MARQAAVDSPAAQAGPAVPSDAQLARAARRAFRPLRSTPAVVVAALLALLTLLAAAEILSHLLDRPLGLLPVERLDSLGRQTQWSDPLALVVATGLALLGLLLVLLACVPGRRRALPLHLREPAVVAGITQAALRRIAGEAALSVAGVSSAKVKVRRRALWVRAASPLHDTEGLAEQVCQVVADRVGQLALLGPLPVLAVVRGRTGEPEDEDRATEEDRVTKEDRVTEEDRVTKEDQVTEDRATEEGS